MKTSFDFIAPFYDRLAKLVFGRSIINSQLHFLNLIPDQASVLILGGGTGWILEELIARKPDCAVCYIEASSKMLQLTHQRKLNDNITLIHGTEDHIPATIAFDAVITNFYLDLFPEDRLDKVIRKVTERARPASVWIATDFIDEGKWWQRAMLKVMYFFFRNVSAVEAAKLPAWKKRMLQHLWVEQDSKIWYGGFIGSVIMKCG